MSGQDFYEIFKNYKDVELTKKGLSITFDSREHAAEAYKALNSTLKEYEASLKEAGIVKE